MLKQCIALTLFGDLDPTGTTAPPFQCSTQRSSSDVTANTCTESGRAIHLILVKFTYTDLGSKPARAENACRNSERGPTRGPLRCLEERSGPQAGGAHFISALVEMIEFG